MDNKTFEEYMKQLKSIQQSDTNVPQKTIETPLDTNVPQKTIENKTFEEYMKRLKSIQQSAEKQKPLTEGSLPENIVEQESQRQLTVLQQDAQKEAAKIKTEKRMEEQKTRMEAEAMKRFDIAIGKKGLEENLQKMKDLVSTEATIQNYEELPDSYKKLVSEKQFNEWKDQGEMTGRQRIGQEKNPLLARLPYSPLRAAEKISLNNAIKRLELGEQGYIDWAKKQTEYRYEYMEGGKYRKIKQNLSKKRIKKAAEDQHKRDKERRDEYLIKLAEQQVRGTTMAGNVGLGISEVPAYMIEFIALTPLTSATVSKKAYGALKILKPIVKNYKLRRIAAKSVAVVYGGALRAFLQPHRVAEGTYTQQVESNLGIIDDRSLFESLGESFTDNWIENTTEMLGAGGGALGKMSSKRAQEFFKAIGMGGFFGEYGEEVAGDFLRAVFNVGEFRNDEGNIVDRLIKAAEKNVDLENILTTSGVLGATQVGMQVGTQGASIPTRIRNKRIEKQIKKIEKRLSSLIEIEQKPKTEIEIKKKPKIEEKAETEDTPQEVKVKKLKALNNAIAQDEKIKIEDKKETEEEKDKTTTQRTGAKVGTKIGTKLEGQKPKIERTEVEPTAEQIKQAEQPKQKITSTYETKTIPVEQTDNVVKGVANLLSDTNPTSEQKVALIEEFEDELGDYTDEMTSIIESDESNAKLIPLFNKNKADIKSRLQKSTNKDTQKLIKDVQPIQEKPKITPVEAIPKELEPLAVEAKKYKSADEFIKSQEPEKLEIFEGDKKRWKRLNEFRKGAIEDELGY